MLKYMDAIEGLATSSLPMHVAVNDELEPPAAGRRARPTSSSNSIGRKTDRRVMCAYIALYAERRPDDVTIYGDYPTNGYILTPTLPPGLTPAPKPTHTARTRDNTERSDQTAVTSYRCRMGALCRPAAAV